MSSLRFTIIRTLTSQDRSEIAMEYDEKQILSRLQRRTRENLSETETHLKHRWSKEEVNEAVGKAFKELVTEFKDNSIKIYP